MPVPVSPKQNPKADPSDVPEAPVPPTAPVHCFRATEDFSFADAQGMLSYRANVTHRVDARQRKALEDMDPPAPIEWK